MEIPSQYHALLCYSRPTGWGFRRLDGASDMPLFFSSTQELLAYHQPPIAYRQSTGSFTRSTYISLFRERSRRVWGLDSANAPINHGFFRNLRGVGFCVHFRLSLGPPRFWGVTCHCRAETSEDGSNHFLGVRVSKCLMILCENFLGLTLEISVGILIFQR